MNLVDLIEKRRFLGREFLVFLWFESELLDGRVVAGNFGAVELRLEGQLTLTMDKEQARLKGVSPSNEPEAHEALRRGLLPAQARMRVSTGELSYAFVFTADTLALSGIKIPNVVKDEIDEQFYERMYLVEELEALFASLYAKFIAIRLSEAWDEQVLPAIRAWIRGEETMHPDVYQKLRARIPAIGTTTRPKSVAPPAEDDKPVRKVG